jgi:hypothetical protein
MNIVFNADQAREIWKRVEPSSARGNRGIRRGAIGLWNSAELADIILDDGAYLDEVVCFGDNAMGVATGGHTGFMPFTDCREIKGRRVRAFLKWTSLHKVPLIGLRLRRHWARKMGVVPERPGWVPRF